MFVCFAKLYGRIDTLKMTFLCLSATIFLLAAFPRQANAIMCYDCNSAFDPNCGDPFFPRTIAIVNCSTQQTPEHIEEMTSVICRKTVQIVSGKVRVIRRCGYIVDKSRDDKACMLRSGTFEINLQYCSCTKDLCNASTKSRPDIATISISILLFPLTAIFLPLQL